MHSWLNMSNESMDNAEYMEIFWLVTVSQTSGSNVSFASFSQDFMAEFFAGQQGKSDWAGVLGCVLHCSSNSRVLSQQLTSGS